MFVSAVIPAAGLGSRMKMDKNKQFIHLDAKPLIVKTLEVFENSTLIDEIILVLNEQDFFYCKDNILKNHSFGKIRSLTIGGSERQYSVFNGLKNVNNNCDIVLIHDGARPFIKDEIISNIINSANKFGAAIAAVPVKDTIKQADRDGFVDKTLEREILWSIQTPQAFKYDLILNAHKKALEDGFLGSDDAVLLERMGIKTKIVMGGYENIKITTREDLYHAEAILRHS